jgi:hypothetical protein
MLGLQSSLCDSSTSPRGSKRGSNTAFIDHVDVLLDECKKKSAELEEWKRRKKIFEVEFLTTAGVDIRNSDAVTAFLTSPLWDTSYVDQGIAEASTEYEAAKKKLESAQESGAASGKKAAPSLSPSKLTAANIHQARGSVDVHDRDSGVARHAAFLAVLQSFSEKGWDAKKNLLTTNCGGVFEDTVGSAVAATDFDTQLRNLCVHISNAQVANSGGAANTLDKRESVFSEELQFRLSHFCEKCALPIRFSHQFPTAVSGSGEDKSDIACFSLKDDFRFLRGHIEVKRDDADATGARWQLCGYAAETFHKKVFLSFCMTIDHQFIALYGFMQSTDPRSEKRTFVEHSLLCRAPRVDKDAVERLLGSYFLAVYLSTKICNTNPGEAPYQFCPLYPNAEYMQPKVFRIPTDNVAKVFDYGPFRTAERKPNIDHWKLALALPDTDIVVRQVPQCTDVCLLVTPLFPGNHTPTHPLHIALLCDQLSLLHTAGKWHGDVLCQNVCFSLKDDETKTALIDYDYSHLPLYPKFWNTELPERHPEAEGGLFVHTKHDVYAAIAILCMYFKFDGPQEHMRECFAPEDFDKDKHPHLEPSWNGKSAKYVAEWIRENAGKIVRQDLQNKPIEEVQTGSPPEKKRN